MQGISLRTTAVDAIECARCPKRREVAVAIALAALVLCGCGTEASTGQPSAPADVVGANGANTDGSQSADGQTSGADAFVPPDGGDACKNVACDDNNPCTDDWCEAGKCKHSDNTAGCDDGNGCTASDTCKAGACVPGPAANCDDANLCTDDSCDDVLKACGHKPNVAPCNDGNACTLKDLCDKGGCKPGAGHPCNDNDACTDDSCDKVSGCVHVKKAGCATALPPCDPSAGIQCASGVCDMAHHVCVPCLKTSDCGKDGYVCSQQKCVFVANCQSGADCKATKQVCDKANGVCVDCVTADDCGVDQKCVESMCVAAPKCKLDGDCAGVCDTQAGVCVGCVTSSDCKAGTFCAPWKACVPVVCSGQVCSGTTLFVCAKAGDGFAPGAACPATQECNATCAPASGCGLIAKSGSGMCEAAPIESVATLIPAGAFKMGCVTGDTMCGGDESPQHNVTLDAFYMDAFEVTVAKYKACVDAGKCSAPGTGAACNWNAAGKEQHPVNCVKWSQADAFCKWADPKGALPTEAQWEKAARGGLEGKKYPWGDQDPTCTAGQANTAVFFANDVAGCDKGGTWAVGAGGSKNGYGLYDMSGNVWEWVADWHNSGYYGTSPASNPVGPVTGSFRVLRGGGWVEVGKGLRASERDGSNPDYDNYDVGFRCIRSP